MLLNKIVCSLTACSLVFGGLWLYEDHVRCEAFQTADAQVRFQDSAAEPNTGDGVKDLEIKAYIASDRLKAQQNRLEAFEAVCEIPFKCNDTIKVMGSIGYRMSVGFHSSQVETAKAELDKSTQERAAIASDFSLPLQDD